MITVKTSDLIKYVRNHITEERYNGAHRIDVVIPILNNPRIRTEFVFDKVDSVFCFHNDFWDFDGNEDSKADRDRYLSEYATRIIHEDDIGWYRIWWRIR